MMIGFALLLLLILFVVSTSALNVVLAGGTGSVGRTLLPQLADHQVTVLSRNAFLAAAPNRVTETFGYLGKALLERNKHVTVRDWDAGDLLDTYGCDWVGWQQDCLPDADVVVHLTGGWTVQREMACERLLREAYAFCKGDNALLHITVNPRDDELDLVSPTIGKSIKQQRIAQCEAMVQANAAHSQCLRVEANRVNDACDEIAAVIAKWAQEKATATTA